MALSAIFRFLNSVHLTAAPDAAIAVLVGGEILEDRLHLSLLFASAGLSRAICAAGHAETCHWPLGSRSNMKRVEVRVGDVALELAELAFDAARWPC